MTTRTVAFIFLFGLTILPASALPQDALPADVPMPSDVPASQRLTLTEAENIAEADNPQIAQAQHTVAGAHATLESQRSFINPTVDYSSLNNTVAPINGLGQIGNYSAYATLETNGAEHFRANQAKFQLRGAEAGAVTTRLTLRQSVDDAYSALQVANSQLENERDVYSLVLKLRDLTQKQFELGSGTQANAIRAQIALTQEEQNLIAAVAMVKQARAALDVQLGRPPDTPVDAAEPLAYHPAAVPDKDALLARAMAARPEVASADAGVNAARAAVGLQKAAYIPDLTFGSQINAGPIEMGFVLPIDLGSIHGEVDSAREQVKVQEAVAAQTRLSVRSDVENGYIALTQARKTVDLYESGILPQTEDLLNRVTQGFSLGADTILDVIDAQQTCRSTRNSYYAAVGTYNQAVDQLNRAIGGTYEALTPVPAAPAQPALPTTTAAPVPPTPAPVPPGVTGAPTGLPSPGPGMPAPAAPAK